METINITTMKVTWKENRKESQHIKKKKNEAQNRKRRKELKDRKQNGNNKYFCISN